MKFPFHLEDPGTRRYVLRCLRWRLRQELQCCPVCGSRSGPVIDRKMAISSLVDCGGCGIRYRRPQEPPGFAEEFYQQEYQSSQATILPSDAQLGELIDAGFRGWEKDFADKIGLLAELGLKRGSAVLDYGASWGYGVWQLRDAGFDAEGFELSRARAAFGREKLGLRMIDSVGGLPTSRYDAVFSNHVLEHIPDVSAAFGQLARVLKPGGLLLAFVPNGSEACRVANFRRFHTNWGRLHPIYLTDAYLRRQLSGVPYRLASKRYDEPAEASLLGGWHGCGASVGNLEENELMIGARLGG